jgi:hypothetical protein
MSKPRPSGLSAGRAVQRLILRTERTPLRVLWSLLYRGMVAAVVGVLRLADPGAAVYLKGGTGLDEPVFGGSDVDIIAVVAAGSDMRKARVARAWELLSVVPLLPRLVSGATYDEIDLRRAMRGSCITYSLDEPSDHAAFVGPEPVPDAFGVLERPGNFGPTRDWRVVGRTDRRPELADQTPEERRIAVWLELQFWSRYLYAVCADPRAVEASYMCFKLVLEPLRSLLWLLHGRQRFRRSDVLVDARRFMPEESEAVEVAAALRAEIPRLHPARLEDTVRLFIRLCDRVVERIGEEIDEAGATEVELLGLDPVSLTTGGGEMEGLRSVVAQDAAIRLLPLADWRALVVPGMADETLGVVSRDPHSSELLGTLARASSDGAYPLLRSNGLLLLPAAKMPVRGNEHHPSTLESNRQRRVAAWARAKLRGIQCAASDPVTWALLERRSQARFPNVRGWHAHDVARRAVAEHSAWLRLPDDGAPPMVRGWIEPQQASVRPTGLSLARLFTAARAALFLESVDTAKPEVAVTLAAVAGQLAGRSPTSEAVASEALEALRSFRQDGREPAEAIVLALRRAVLELDAYARRS